MPKRASGGDELPVGGERLRFSPPLLPRPPPQRPHQSRRALRKRLSKI